MFLTRTTLGRFIYVHGDNAEAARLTGVAVRPLTMLEYALSSAIGYVGGVIMIAETGLMHLQVAGSTLIFDVIMVVVLGGVSLVGGRGNVPGVLAGTLLIGVLLNGMTIMDLDIELKHHQGRRLARSNISRFCMCTQEMRKRRNRVTERVTTGTRHFKRLKAGKQRRATWIMRN